ncbi:polyprenyl synthetase family protein [Luteimonas sp. MC1782]|uniref:polyprenyl synthetase family protein n=1 Tax=Luteimonas sp. MC1782 TaxID=2760305 RepID=UPI001602ADF1|nr:farnesyl diphosphate synthase [Luteimonas sp. MC1782]MBB1472123.1 polyprenyl synthetase family protein [Luteimonas sp. MC1782]
MPDPEARAARIAAWRERIDAVLERTLERNPAAEPRLHAAMRHAVLLGGKRMRPLLVYATGTAFGADEDALDAAAAAIELVHAYSLVHDDLPAMDDDALRRGQPTVHVAFDEATAILAGDALQALAFAVLADAGTSDPVRVAMLRELAAAAGGAGMCGGQALDLAATGDASATLVALEHLHALKTGALIRAAVRMGAIVAGADADARLRLDAYADALGLAFQVRDDLLDVEGDSATMGKTAGKDAAQDKATFPALVGVDASRGRLATLASTIRYALAPFGPRAATLATLAEFAVQRRH